MQLQVRPIALAAAILLASATGLTMAQEVRRPYIVQLQQEPAASYKGDIAGLPATQPAPGAPFDARALHVQNYVKYLGARKRDVLATVAGARVFADYSVVVNGFAAMLTDAEVLTLKMNGAVADVQADEARQLDTISTSAFLGLSKPGGLWSQYGGGSPLKGEGMVVGIIDGGIWPENPAFADRVDGNGKPSFNPGDMLAYTSAPASFTGSCTAGDGFDPARHCNNKLIGAKFFNAGFRNSGSVMNWSDYASARDSNVGSNGSSSGHGGHGDHTASTAAGNGGVGAVVNGIPLGDASGIAPRARVAAYKVCWTYNDSTATDGTNAKNSCFTSDSISAIDAAVRDGVNVINYSISGGASSGDAVEQAFFRAVQANVFVAASAGNAGPDNTVAHVSPWLTTVAASTHDRSFYADVALGSGASYGGASLNVAPLPNAPLVRAEDAGMGGVDASLCYSAGAPSGQALLDPVKVAGKVVICTRGGNARVDKSLAVKQAGGVGMVLRDNGTGLVADAHAVPSVHVSAADGDAIKAYAVAQPGDATAGMGSFYNKPKTAPIMAGFSSRGPNKADPNVLKPDLTAPGVDIVASVTPALTAAQRAGVSDGSFVPPAAYDSMQGTSMSSPHVAGLALLLRQAHPAWSPAAVKSALMTTAFNTENDNLAGASNGLLPWSQGAGHVDPNKAVDPGLVYDAGKADFIQYQCKVNPTAVSASNCSTYGTLDETYNLNLPSITVASVPGTVTVRRKVTNVSASAATYQASIEVPGFSAAVTPPKLELGAGESGSFTVRLSTSGAPVNTWQFGQLSWTDGNHVVRIPVSARAGIPVTAPVEVVSDKASGAKLFLVKTSFSGLMGSIKGGLKELDVTPEINLERAALTEAAYRAACEKGENTASMRVTNVAVPADAMLARFAIRQQDSGARDDNDMGVIAPDGSWTYFGTSGSNESVQWRNPAPGNYRVCVLAWNGAGKIVRHKLASAVVTAQDVGYKFVAAVAGKSVAGVNTPVAVSWSGLQADKRYVGAVQFKDLDGTVQATTAVRVETGLASVPVAQTARDGTPVNVQE